MNYQRIYDSFIADRLANPPTTRDYEVHHICPWTYSKDNSQSNLVALTRRDHFFAHMLLARIHQDASMWHALSRMAFSKRFIRLFPDSKIKAIQYRIRLFLANAKAKPTLFLNIKTGELFFGHPFELKEHRNGPRLATEKITGAPRKNDWVRYDEDTLNVILVAFLKKTNEDLFTKNGVLRSFRKDGQPRRPRRKSRVTEKKKLCA